MKIYKKFLFVLYFVSFLTLDGLTQYQAQITQEAPDWLTKYWLYRWRFVNDFIKIGDQRGESIPFAERNWYHQQDLKTGDGTQKLGMYMCVLATEFKLLKNNGDRRIRCFCNRN